MLGPGVGFAGVQLAVLPDAPRFAERAERDESVVIGILPVSHGATPAVFGVAKLVDRKLFLLQHLQARQGFRPAAGGFPVPLDFLTEKFESISSRHVFFGSDIVLPAAEPAAHVGRRSHRNGGRQTECQSQEPAIRFTRIRHSPNSDADAPIRVRPEGVSPARACSAPLLGIPGIIVAVVAVAENPLLTSTRRAAASTFFACDAREARRCAV